VQAWNIRSADETREASAAFSQRNRHQVLTIAMQEIEREEHQLVMSR
jgi:hypothetical protein